MNVNLANSSFCFWVWLHATSIMLKGVEYFRRIFIAQGHTLQDHFCSMIDEFPVWSSETDQAAMMWIVPYSEREGATEHNAVLCRWSPDLDKEPSERCNITSPSLPNRSLAWIRCTSFTQGNWTNSWNKLKIISVHSLPKDTAILSKRPSFISLNTLLKRCVSCMLSTDCKLSYWLLKLIDTRKTDWTI